MARRRLVMRPFTAIDATRSTAKAMATKRVRNSNRIEVRRGTRCGSVTRGHVVRGHHGPPHLYLHGHVLNQRRPDLITGHGAAATRLKRLLFSLDPLLADVTLGRSRQLGGGVDV
ncbi:hypothetical protein CFC21_082997 [Triticum aestivum]|uniref:Uncharacterized protein n=2 Tax=Triticum aestivum TaxID=4565 RepID=A0A9R1I8J4_WHEAT|nr:hypothetical protein CFC21_082997 [Triticum aestivum]